MSSGKFVDPRMLSDEQLLAVANPGDITRLGTASGLYLIAFAMLAIGKALITLLEHATWSDIVFWGVLTALGVAAYFKYTSDRELKRHQDECFRERQRRGIS